MVFDKLKHMQEMAKSQFGFAQTMMDKAKRENAQFQEKQLKLLGEFEDYLIRIEKDIKEMKKIMLGKPKQN